MKARLRKDTALDRRVDVPGIMEKLDVFWNTAGDRIVFDQIFMGLFREELPIMGEGDLPEPQLSCSAPVKWAGIG